MIAIISFDKVPPGSYWYQQDFNGHTQKFHSTPIVDDLVKRVARFRVANNLPRQTDIEVLTDIVAFTCGRLGNDPQWCYETERTVAQLQAQKPKSGGCGGCGAKV